MYFGSPKTKQRVVALGSRTLNVLSFTQQSHRAPSTQEACSPTLKTRHLCISVHTWITPGVQGTCAYLYTPGSHLENKAPVHHTWRTGYLCISVYTWITPGVQDTCAYLYTPGSRLEYRAPVHHTWRTGHRCESEHT